MRYDKLHLDNLAIYKLFKKCKWIFFHHYLKYKCSGCVNPLSLGYFESHVTKLNKECGAYPLYVLYISSIVYINANISFHKAIWRTVIVSLGYKDKENKTMLNNLQIYIYLCELVAAMAIIANKLISSNVVLFVTLTPDILIHLQ